MSDNAPHPTPHPAALSAQQAADMLNINEKTVRRWIERGKLPAAKDSSGAYQIDPEAVVRAAAATPHKPAAPAADRPQDNAAPAADMAAATPRGQAAASIDLQPLADVIERQGEEIRRLTEAATLWQFRARQLEEQVKQLTAGMSTDAETDSESSENGPNAPRTSERPLGATEAASSQSESNEAPLEPQKTARASWWRRLLFGE